MSRFFVNPGGPSRRQQSSGPGWRMQARQGAGSKKGAEHAESFKEPGRFENENDSCSDDDRAGGAGGISARRRTHPTPLHECSVMARHGLERGHIGDSSDRRLDPDCGSDDSHLEASPMSYEFHTSRFSMGSRKNNSIVRKDNEGGYVLVTVAVLLFVLVAFMALAIDTGVLFGARTSSQGAADAA